ncbi:MAG: DUF3084 domain-containing protein [Cyanobacteria bacterium P01_D01_bin.73]
MAFGYVLIVLAAIALGGLIATVGDRLGSRVGKARLRLFNLRPRQTATVITIATGGIISALTVGLVVLLGALELDQVQTQLRQSREDLDEANADQKEVSQSLNKLRATQRVTRGQLERSQERLEAAQQRFGKVSKRAVALQSDIRRLGAERQRLDQQLQRLQVDRDRLGVENQQKGAQIAQREAQLRAVGGRLQAAQRQFSQSQAELGRLSEEVRSLEQQAQNLRGGSVALRRGQVLTATLVQVRSPEETRLVLQRLLNVANEAASQAIRPGLDREQLVRISRGELESAIAQLPDGKEYLVRVLSAANYVVGEGPVQVGLEVIENRTVAKAGTLLTRGVFGQGDLDRRGVRDRLELLIAQAQFRARLAGVVIDTPRVVTVDGLVRLALWLVEQREPVEVQILANSDLQTVGPLVMRFVAVRDGEVLFDSAEPSPPPDSAPSSPSPRRNPAGETEDSDA